VEHDNCVEYKKRILILKILTQKHHINPHSKMPKQLTIKQHTVIVIKVNHCEKLQGKLAAGRQLSTASSTG